MKTQEQNIKEEVRNLTSTDLHKRASELKIKNYSRLVKDQLQKKVIDALIEQLPEEEEKFVDVERQELSEKVDAFVDELIAQKRTGVYNEVMKALGGKFNSDLDDLLEQTSKAQMKDALAFQKITSTPEPKKDKEESTHKVAKKKSTAGKQTAPRAGSKSEKIYNYLKNHPKEPTTKVAKHFNTYYSVVDRVVKNYL